jgi:hypothetical protein
MIHLPFSKKYDVSTEMTSEYINLIKEACDFQCMFALLNLFSTLDFLRLNCDIYIIALFQFVCVALNYCLETLSFPRITLCSFILCDWSSL